MKRWAWAIALLPLCYGMTRGVIVLVAPLRDVPESSLYFFTGMAFYAALQWMFDRPMRVYVFGHELTHALAAWASGAQVRKFHVTSRGGYVTLSKTNLFIALAPYIFPLYALIVLLGYLVIDRFVPLAAYWRWLLLLVGMALAFHVGLTVHALRQGQPDLKLGGRFLSAVLIYLGNAGILAAVLLALFPRTTSLKQFAGVAGQESWRSIEFIMEKGAALARLGNS